MAKTNAMIAETIELHGHIIDSLTLSKVLDIILRDGGRYRINRFYIGATSTDISHAEILVEARDSPSLEAILHELQQHGAQRQTGDATVSPAPADGVFPDGFYSTTNLDTSVRFQERWLPVEPVEMDCGIVITGGGDDLAARCTPLHRVKRSDAVVVGDSGVRVVPLERPDPHDSFSFMGSDVSTERPKELVVKAVANAMVQTRAAGKQILFVGGPAIVHTGSAQYLESIVKAGWIDILFAGNALAAHDIERALFGTSLGIEIESGKSMRHGHEHHLRAINRIRAAGSIRGAVETGLLAAGIMHACIKRNVDVVLAGSIRDDGPLPDVITDSIQAQDAMRRLVPGVGVALMVATTLHSVATGNLLPASVRTVCVDSDADTVIKLMDRGSHQAFGLITDCEFFLKELAAHLPGSSTQRGA
ncbi:MAG TPA: TIGR00300 family protein [Chthonomonadales bacterium]|nr:TIGR00300 family protein [Chthonomonadales bacterium]